MNLLDHPNYRLSDCFGIRNVLMAILTVLLCLLGTAREAEAQTHHIVCGVCNAFPGAQAILIDQLDPAALSWWQEDGVWHCGRGDGCALILIIENQMFFYELTADDTLFWLSIASSEYY